MSKRELSKYLTSLSKKELEIQVTELYERLKEVREFYNFVFNPKEDKMLDEAKFKISKEYFPPTGRKPKRRRSVAQKQIRNFIKLGVDPTIIAEVMLFNIEVSLLANAEKPSNQDSFYKSIYNSFEEAIDYLNQTNQLIKNINRIERIVENTREQKWINTNAFDDYLENTTK